MARFSHPYDLPDSILDTQVYSGFTVTRDGRDLGMFFTTIRAAFEYILELGEQVCVTWEGIGFPCFPSLRFYGSCFDQIEVVVVQREHIYADNIETLRIVMR